MIDRGEQLPTQIVLDPKNTRQESLQRQLDQLDNTQPGDRVLGEFLSMLYRPQNYQQLDQFESSINYVHYQPKSALSGHTTHALYDDFVGIYDYQPITEAIKNVDDPFNIFPEIQTIFDRSKIKKITPVVLEIAKTITEKTNIPVVFSQPDLSSKNHWTVLKNGDIIYSRIEKNDFGRQSYVYRGTSQAYSDLMTRGYPNPDDLEFVDDAIILNQNLTDKPAMISTCLHELGHIVEERYVLSQKQKEFPDQTILGTEVLSSLYGLKTALLMAKSNFDLSFRMVQDPVRTYNWVLTGTVAP